MSTIEAHNSKLRMGLLFFAIIILAAGFKYSFGYSFAVNDDRLGYYYAMYSNSFDDEKITQYRQLNDRVEASILTTGYDDLAYYRYKVRQKYERNYPLASFLYYQTRQIFFGQAPDNDQFPQFISTAIAAMFAVSMIFAGAIFVSSLGLLCTDRVLIATTLALGLLFVLKAIPTGGLTQSTALFGRVDRGIIESVSLFLIKPDLVFDPFGLLQKSQFVLIAFAAFAVRWSGKLGVAYVLLAVSSLFHQALGVVLLAHWLACDTVLRPRQLFQWGVVLCIGTVFAGFVIFGVERLSVVSQLGYNLNELSWMVWAAGLGAFALVLLGLRLRHTIVFIRDRFLNWAGDVGSDLILLGILWAGGLLVSWLMIQKAGEYDWLFWGVIPGRILGMLRPAIFLGGILIALSVFGDRLLKHPRVHFSAYALILTASAVLVLKSPSIGEAYTREVSNAIGYEKQIYAGRIEHFGLKDENVLLYAMTKSFETGKPYAEDLFLK